MLAGRHTQPPQYRDALVLALILVPLFVLGGRWGTEANVDAIAAGAPAWQLVEEGTLDLSAYAGQNPWFVEDQSGRTVSDRPPGLIISAIPGYAIWRVDSFVNGPATLVALSTTLLATLLVWRMVRELLDRWAAIWAGIVFALGTTTWAISSAQLWPHGPGQLAAVFGLLMVARRRYWSGGASAAFAIAVRPVAAVYAAVLGLAEASKARSRGPAVKYGLLAAMGLVLVLIYNRWLFAEWTLRGGHESGLGGGFGFDLSPSAYFENLWVMLFSLKHGFLILSPIVLVGVIGVLRYRSKIPPWAKSAAVAGLAYLLVHAGLNRASGGAIMFYRYPLEAIALASIALAVGAAEVHRKGGLGRFVVMAAIILSIGLQVVNVFILSCSRGSPSTLACTLF